MTGDPRRPDRPGLPPRPATPPSPVAPGRHRPDHRRELVLPVHLGLVALLALATIVLFAIPPGNGDCCVPIAALGLFTLAELVAVLIGIAIAGFTGRHSPLALIDAAITAPLMALVPSAFGSSVGSSGGSSGSLFLLTTGLLVVGLVSAVLAARVVRQQGIERIILAGGLALLAAFTLAVPVTTVVPILVLAAVLLPQMDMLEGGTGDASSRGKGGTPGATPAPGRRRAPDAAAILAQRRPDPGRLPHDAPPAGPPAADPPGSRPPAADPPPAGPPPDHLDSG